MSLRICLGASTMSLLEAGGHLWFFLNWALGLRAVGGEVIWLEQVDPKLSPAETLETLEGLKNRLKPFGLADSVALVSPAGAIHESIQQHCVSFEAALESDLLLNLGDKLDAEIVARFRRSALVDIDPGLLQIWCSQGDSSLTKHDVYFSTGETVGTASATFPDCGVTWDHVPPAVYLPQWPVTGAAEGSAYTTVSSWWGWWEVFGDETFNNEKQTTFMELIDLPSQTDVALELALALWDLRNHEVVELLKSHGWQVRHASDVGGTPEEYRSYVAGSRGEFSCAKPSCMRLQNAWVSDRSLCYMAMGKPVVVQHTGPSRILPDADGMFRFRNQEEAARSLAIVESDYEHHGRQARALVEEHFDAEQVVRRVLERALE